MLRENRAKLFPMRSQRNHCCPGENSRAAMADARPKTRFAVAELSSRLSGAICEHTRAPSPRHKSPGRPSRFFHGANGPILKAVQDREGGRDYALNSTTSLHGPALSPTSSQQTLENNSVRCLFKGVALIPERFPVWALSGIDTPKALRLKSPRSFAETASTRFQLTEATTIALFLPPLCVF